MDKEKIDHFFNSLSEDLLKEKWHKYDKYSPNLRSMENETKIIKNMESSDTNFRISKLMTEIGNYLGLSSENLLFDFSINDGVTKLDLITINPQHQQSFLFKTTRGVTKLDALIGMIEYIKEYREIDSSYTIQWSERGSNQLITSYFRGKNVSDVLEKFVWGRDINTLVIFSIILNPIS
jgi:hypothetical protein